MALASPGAQPSKLDLKVASSGERSALAEAQELLDRAQAVLARASSDTTRLTTELRARIKSLEANAADMEELLIRTERQAAQLASLYVATYQLHASLQSEDVSAAIADIAINLLGAERFVILLRDEAGPLRVAREHSALAGNQLYEGAEYVGGDALVDACLVDGSLRFGPGEESTALVVVPFVAHGELLGALVVEALFRHKQELSQGDHELLALLGAHAASALLATRAFRVAQRKLNAYEGLLGLLRNGPRKAVAP
jgi:GAF domain